MHKKKKSYALLAIVGLLSVTIVVGLGCRRWKNATPEEKADWIVKRLGKNLELNYTQQKKLNSIKIEFLKEHRKYNASHARVHRVLIEEIKKDNINRDRIRAAFIQRGEEMQKMRGFFIRKLSEFHGTLSPRQRLMLARKISKINQKKLRHHW